MPAGAVTALGDVSIRVDPRHSSRSPVRRAAAESTPPHSGLRRSAQRRLARVRGTRRPGPDRSRAQPHPADANRLRLPAVLPAADAHGVGEHRAAAVGGGRDENRPARADSGVARLRRPAGAKRSSAVAVIRRRDAARRDRARAGEPPALLLADEPTGELDEDTGAQIAGLFDRVHADGTAIVVVTHNPAVAARAGRHLAMKSGRVVTT